MTGSADGIFGEQTEKAVMKLQEQFGITQTGMITNIEEDVFNSIIG